MAPDLERCLADFFRRDSRSAAAVYLFGSEARGDARPDSDVDLGVLLAGTPPSTFDAQPYDLEGALERLLGRHVDVVILNRAPVDLRARVLRHGRLILDRDPSARIQFELRTRNEAFDFEPVLREYRKARPGR